MQRYSAFAIARRALSYHQGWERAWPSPAPRKRYKVIVVGAGGHGLATAYYLARNHGITDVAVLEKGWLGGGNTGRNTTIIRSNYLQPASTAVYKKAHQLYEDLSQQLNFNIMFSPRGVLMLAQTEHELRAWKRTFYANRAARIESQLVTPEAIKEICPIIETRGPRYPVLGGLWQPRGGTARHDAVAWGYARACLGSGHGHHPEMRGHRGSTGHRRARSQACRPRSGEIGCEKLCIVVAGHSGALAEMAGFRLPVESVALQALVSEPIKPCMDVVVMANTVHGYLSQSDKGEMVIGGGARTGTTTTPSAAASSTSRKPLPRSARRSRSSAA